MSAPSTSTDEGHFKKPKPYKKDASKASHNDMFKLFGERHYVGCDRHHTRAEIEGATWQEVLKNILDDVEQFNLSKSSDEIVNMIAEMQANHQDHEYISTFVEQMGKVLARVTFDDNSRESMRASFNNMVDVMHEDQDSNEDSVKELDQVFKIKLDMNEVAVKMSSMCSGTELHTVWVTLWEAIICAAVQKDRWDVKIGRNGACENIFIIDGEKKITKPDLLIERNITSSSPGPRRFVRLCVVELKTSMHGQNSTLQTDPIEYSGTETSDLGSCESPQKNRKSTGVVDSFQTASTEDTEPQRKKQRTEPEKRIRADYSGRMCNLKTQHFMELLCALRDRRYNHHKIAVYTPIKCFGLYIVMHRVHLTCLNVESLGNLGKENKARFVHSSPEEFHDQNKQGTKFRLVCSKYLNMFKPAHFRALVTYMHFLSWHEYKFVTDHPNYT